MNDNIATFILTVVFPPLIGALTWLVHRMIESNAKSHDSLKDDVRRLKSNMCAIELQLKKLDSSATVLDVDEARKDLALVKTLVRGVESAVVATKEELRYTRDELRSKITSLTDASLSRIREIEKKQGDIEYFKADVLTRVSSGEQKLANLTTLTKDNTIKVNQVLNKKAE